jgi:hypothetical protein
MDATAIAKTTCALCDANHTEDGPGQREAAGVGLPPNRYAHAALRAILTNETGWTTHSILRIASWIAKIGGSIKRKIPLRGIVDVTRDANRSVRFRVEITVRTLSHQWSSGPAEKAGRDASFCNSPHGAFRVTARSRGRVCSRNNMGV